MSQASLPGSWQSTSLYREFACSATETAKPGLLVSSLPWGAKHRGQALLSFCPKFLQGPRGGGIRRGIAPEEEAPTAQHPCPEGGRGKGREDSSQILSNYLSQRHDMTAARRVAQETQQGSVSDTEPEGCSGRGSG